MGGLIMMKLQRPQLFLYAKQGTLTLEQVAEYLGFSSQGQQDATTEWEQQWWTYLLADEVPSEMKDFGRSLRFDYSFRDRKDVVKYTANDVIDRLNP